MAKQTGKVASAKAVDALIAKAIADYGTAKASTQAAAVAILMHAEKHRDYSKANALVHGIKTAARADALVGYFIKFGGLEVGENADGEKEFTGWHGPEFIRENFQKAKATDWTTCGKPPAPFGFDLEDSLRKLLASANKAAKKAKANPDKFGNVVHIDTARLQALAQFVNNKEAA